MPLDEIVTLLRWIAAILTLLALFAALLVERLTAIVSL